MKTRYWMDGVMMPYDKDVGFKDQRKNSLGIIVMAVMYNSKNQPIIADLIPIGGKLPERIEPTQEVEIIEKLYMEGESLVTIKKISGKKGSKEYYAAYEFCDNFFKQKKGFSLEEMSKYHELEFVSGTVPMKRLYTKKNGRNIS